MNETVREWINKAEGDFRTAGREITAEEQPNYDAVCFHAQQCIEKLIKAILIDYGTVPLKVHDLAVLSRLLTSVCDDWDWNMEELRFLSRASVEYRYPGESADSEEAKKAFDICRSLRDKLLLIVEREL